MIDAACIAVCKSVTIGIRYNRVVKRSRHDRPREAVDDDDDEHDDFMQVPLRCTMKILSSRYYP